ncbi:MAG TPA: hypothetical protein EYP32_00875, partial [Aquificaceae bacterium]|nr:hypothetical protein [Aquificaceae bacterium]
MEQALICPNDNCITHNEPIISCFLINTKNSLLRQYKALLDVEGVNLEFEDDAIRAFAHLSVSANEKAEDIGARRLHTVIERSE